ncbi:MAG: ABC transporter permease [Hyphomicrobiales bacterium]|nr:ABC transporter permease [Hyphomicrobiales bacterium]
MAKRYYAVLSLVALVAAWALGAMVAGGRLFPGPLEVLSFVVAETASGALPWHLAITLWRVAAAFALAMVIGSAVGLAMGRSKATDRLLDPWLILFLNVPALVVIILAYIWAGLTEVAAIAAVAINKIPNVVVTVREGARALDTGLDDMARAFRMSRAETLRHVTLPQLQPYFAAAARSGIALIWKIVLVVELLGRSNGVGFQLHLYFQLFDVTAILGYTLAFVAVMLVVELGMVQPLERRATRWRLKPA